MAFFSKKKDKKENNTTPVLKGPHKQKIGFFVRIQAGEERDYLVENLSMLLESGMDMLRALNAIHAGVRSPAMKKIIDYIRYDIENGLPLWKALKKTQIVPQHILSLFRIGEESGQLAYNLKLINTQQQKERMFRSKIRSAMMYPVLVLVLASGIGIGIAWFVLPQLAGIFGQLNIKLPTITKVLIDIGNFLGEHGIIVMPLLILCLGSILYFVFVYEKTKHIGQFLLFHAPIIGRLVQETELARMGFILGNLLTAGLPITEAFYSLSQATTTTFYKKLYLAIKESIEMGESFQSTFARYPHVENFVPAPIQKMIISGEQSGNLPETFLKVGETFENKTESTSKNLTVLLEPMLLIIVWGGVVMVALSVILPIYSLVGGLNEGATTPAPPKKQTTTQTAELTSDFQQSAPKKTLTIRSDIGTLNIRRTPSGTLLGKVLDGETYTYVEVQSGWYLIELTDGSTGWVSGDYVIDNAITEDSPALPEPSQPEEIPVSNIPTGTPFVEILPTGIGYLNVRQNGVVFTTVTPGDQYPLVSTDNGWVEIRLEDGSTGWITSKYAQQFP